MENPFPGQVVRLVDRSVSHTGGSSRVLAAGLVGRICRVTPFGYCCVQFRGAGCRRIFKSRLVASNESAPACTRACTQGC